MKKRIPREERRNVFRAKKHIPGARENARGSAGGPKKRMHLADPPGPQQTYAPADPPEARRNASEAPTDVCPPEETHGPPPRWRRGSRRP
eukprot:98849-Lingulodinium_polyedra.AAC.1